MKRLLGIVLSMVMILSMLPMQVFAMELQTEELQEEEMLVQDEAALTGAEDEVYELVFDDEDLADSDELLAGYIDRAFLGESDAVPYAALAYNQLSQTAKNLYNTLKTEIVKIAAGERSSSKITASFPSEAVFYAVFDALLSDLAYELYWFDKTAGIRYSGGAYFLYVSEDYSKNGEYKTCDVDTTKTKAASAAAAKFRDVVDAAPTSGTYDVLKYFHDSVINLTDYNYDALEAGTPYGDPWQLIYVFDGDSNTKVVCEGYSKAFKYLCDAVDIDCALATGYVYFGDGSGGAHMWNVVRLNTTGGEKSWLVDCTHDDNGAGSSIDYDLFLKAPISGGVGSYYLFDRGWDTSRYYYDSDMTGIYGTAMLTLAWSDYSKGDEPVYSVVLEEDADLREVLNRVANGAVIDLNGYEGFVNDTTNSDAAPWIIDKSVTIKNGTLSLRAGGIVLGADVIFEDLTLSFANAVRNAIMANGYMLVLDDVTRDESARQVHLFCGGLTGYSGSVTIPYSGDYGWIRIEGNTSLGNVYAGSLSSTGADNVWGYVSSDGDLALVSDVTVAEGASGTMGALYGSGAKETAVSGNWFDFEEPAAPTPDSEKYYTYSYVFFDLYGDVFKQVDGRTYAGYSSSITYYNGNGNMDVLELKNLWYLAVKSGYLAPSFLSDGVYLNIYGGAELDLSSVEEYDLYDGSFFFNELTGGTSSNPGLLTIGRYDTVYFDTINGYVELQTADYRPMDRSTSGVIEDGYAYVCCINSTKPKNGSNIIFRPYEGQNGAKLVYDKTTGLWTGSAPLPELSADSFVIDFPAQLTLKPHEFLNTLAFDISYTPENDDLTPYWISHNVTISKDGEETYSKKWDVADFICEFPELNLKVDFFGEYGEGTFVLYRSDTTRMVEPGTYTVTIDTLGTAGTITNELTLIIDAVEAELSEVDGENGWYVNDVILTAPDGYLIGSYDEKTGVDPAAAADSITVSEDRQGEFEYFLYATDREGGSGYLLRSVEINRDATAPAVNEVDVWSYGGKAKITVSADDGEGSGVAEYELAIDADDVEIECDENGVFTVSGLTVGESYEYTVRVIDAAGNYTDETAVFEVEDIPTPKVTMTVSGGSLNAEGTDFAYGDSINFAVTISADGPVTLDGSSAKGKVVIYRDGEEIYTKTGVAVSNTMKDRKLTFKLDGSKAATRQNVGESWFWAMFIPDDKYAEVVGEASAAEMLIDVKPKALTISGVKPISTDDDGTGLIKLGTLKLVGFASGDTIAIGTNSDVADAIQLPDLSGEGRYYQDYVGAVIDLNDYLYLNGAEEVLANYTIDFGTVSVTLKKNAVPSRIEINTVFADDIAAAKYPNAPGTDYLTLIKKDATETYELTATVYDQYGDVIENLAAKDITWALTFTNKNGINAKAKSVSVKNNILTITSKAMAESDVFTLTATCSKIKDKAAQKVTTAAINVTRAGDGEAYYVGITDANGKILPAEKIVSIPVNAGGKNETAFYVRVWDGYGVEITPDSVVWTWKADPADPKVELTADGKLAVSYAAMQGIYTLVATAGGVSGEIDLNVMKLPAPNIGLTMTSSNKTNPSAFTYGDTVNFTVTVSQGDLMTILDYGNAKASAKGRVEIRDAEDDSVIYTKTGITVSNTMKDVVVKYTHKTIFAVGEHSFYAVFIPDAASEEVVAEARAWESTIDVAKRVLTVTGMKDVSINDDATGLIKLGTLKLNGLVNKDAVTLVTNSGTANTIQLPDPSGAKRYYLNYNNTVIDLSNYLDVSGAEAVLANYTVDYGSVKVTLKEVHVASRIEINTTFGDGIEAGKYPNDPGTDYPTLIKKPAEERYVLAATVYDQYGEVIENLAAKDIKWTLAYMNKSGVNAKAKSVAVKTDKVLGSVLVINSKAMAESDVFTLTATCSKIKDKTQQKAVTAAIDVTRSGDGEAYYVGITDAAGKIVGAEKIMAIPVDEDGVNTFTFGALVWDCYGKAIAANEIEWALIGSGDGVVLNGSTVTVSYGADVGEYTLQATAGGVSGEITVKVIPMPSPKLTVTASSNDKKNPDVYVEGCSINFVVTVAKGDDLTILDNGNAKATAKGKLEIRNAADGSVVYTKTGVSVSNTMKNVVVKFTLKNVKTLGENGFYAVFIPDAGSAGVVAETRTETMTITVIAK